MYLKPEPGANFMIKLGWNCPCFRLFWSLSSCFDLKSLLRFRFLGHMERKHIILAETLAPWYLTGPDLCLNAMRNLESMDGSTLFLFEGRMGLTATFHCLRSDGSANFSEYPKSHSELIICSSWEIAFRTHYSLDFSETNESEVLWFSSTRETERGTEIWGKFPTVMMWSYF